MTVYNINKSIGKSSSGVEYAQLYRYNLIKSTAAVQKYVFVNFVTTNIIYYTRNIGFTDDVIINTYTYLAGQKNRVSSLTVSEFEKTLIQFEKKVTKEYIEYSFKQSKRKLRAWIFDGYVDRVVTYFQDKIVQVDHYTNQLVCREFYEGGKAIEREFYAPDGSVAFNQYYQENEITLTTIEGHILYGRTEFLRYFFKKLHFEKGDIVLIDRGLDLAESVVSEKGESKMGVVIHAEHFNRGKSEKEFILWNNHYEYTFTNAHWFDFFITSTKKQTSTLTTQLQQTAPKFKGKVWTIPVGSVPTTTFTQSNKRVFKVMTASRLAVEKHIEQLVAAVASVKKDIPELAFDIYGAGVKRVELEKEIKKLGAQEYITLKGHHKLTEIYPQYDFYLTASSAEGFGLTLLEALAGGLPIIGLNVDYGNTEFIEGNTGLFIEPGTPSENVRNFAKALKTVYDADYDFATCRKAALAKAQEYSDEKITAKWQTFIETYESGDVL
jgi:accessory Sec system glycosylation protein GtfA